MSLMHAGTYKIPSSRAPVGAIKKDVLNIPTPVNLPIQHTLNRIDSFKLHSFISSNKLRILLFGFLISLLDLYEGKATL